jgi:ATP-binding cassette, subfamily C, bacterial EexD
MVINLLMLVPVLYMMQIYDRVLSSASVPTLVMLSLIAVLLLSLSGFLEWIRSSLMLIVAGRLDCTLSEFVHRKLFPDNVAKFSEDRLSNPRHDLQTLRQYLAGPGAIALFDAPWVFVYIAGLFLLNFWLGLLGVGCALVLLALAVINEIVSAQLVGEAGDAHQRSSQALNQHLANSEYILASGLAARLRKAWLKFNQDAIDLQHEAHSRASVISALSRVFRVVSQSAILGVGAYLAIYKEVSPGAVLAGSVLLGRALAPVDLATAHWRSFLLARAAFSRLQNSLSPPLNERDYVELPRPRGDVSVKDLSVIPPGLTKPVVNNLSFDVPMGSIIAIVGASASGKSTLLRALLGVYSVSEGSIRIGGAEIAQYTSSALSQWVGYLPQDVEILDGTVAQNICGFSDATSDEIVAAAQLAHVHDMILNLPQGYQTKVGNGHSLSAGQKQRVALARAVFGKPALVVLDEPNSNLDEAGDAALLATFNALRSQDTTVICVTHRRNLVQHSDHVLLMVNGQRGMFGTREQFQGALQQANDKVRVGEKK